MFIRKASIAAALLVSTLGAAAHADTFDIRKNAWRAGHNVCAYAQIPGFAGGSGPNGPDSSLRDVDTYLVGHMDAANPYGPEQQFPAINPATGQPIIGPDGMPFMVTVPAHDDVFESNVVVQQKANAIGIWIVAGPNANSTNVRVRPMPANSLVGAPLAYEIKDGGVWKQLTKASVIQKGIEDGLLAALNFGWGGVSWMENGACQ